MKLTKKHIIIEITNTIDGCLEQGGLCGRVIGYPVEQASKVTGLTRDGLLAARPQDLCPGYDVTIFQILNAHIVPHVICKGTKIQ